MAERTKLVDVRWGGSFVYIGRMCGRFLDQGFGNPFVIGRDGARAEVITKFAAYFHERVALDRAYRQKALALAGKALGCWCGGDEARCHGGVIIRWLEAHTCQECGAEATRELREWDGDDGETQRLVVIPLCADHHTEYAAQDWLLGARDEEPTPAEMAEMTEAEHAAMEFTAPGPGPEDEEPVCDSWESYKARRADWQEYLRHQGLSRAY